MANQVYTATPQTALDLPALVRTRDYRRFLAIQFAPRPQRPALYALTAFATEMADIPHHIREPLAGFMRYAWWREALEAMQAGQAPRPHPLLQELEPWLQANPAGYEQLFALIHAGQSMLEEAALPSSYDAALDMLWAQALGGADETALKILRSLPLGQRIGPGRILRSVLSELIT